MVPVVQQHSNTKLQTFTIPTTLTMPFFTPVVNTTVPILFMVFIT